MIIRFAKKEELKAIADVSAAFAKRVVATELLLIMRNILKINRWQSH